MNSPVRRILRAKRVILQAAEMLTLIAESSYECETVDGIWPPGKEDAEEDYNRLRETAQELRSLVRTEARK